MSFFDIVAPASWVRLDPKSPVPGVLFQLAEDFATRATPANRSAVTEGAERGLSQLLEQLANAGSLMVLIAGPSDPISLWQPLVSVTQLRWADGVEPLPALIAVAAKDASAQVYPLEVAVALRTHKSNEISQGELGEAISSLGVDPAAEDSPEDSRLRAELTFTRETFRYWIGLPSDRDAWVEATCVATVPRLPDQADPVPVLQETFDAVLSTFEWTP